MVDSGASATVVGAEQIRAVKASEPDSSRFYNMADGSVIPHKGQKHFVAHTGSGLMKMTTNVADVDMPLMSVAQIVHNGGKWYLR